MTPCQVIGVHDDGAAGLTAHAQELLRAADLVIGAPHQLRVVASLLPEQTERRDANGRVTIVAAWVEEALSIGRRVVVLATGDPLYFGIAAGLIAALGRERVHVVPTLSSVQLAAARLGLPWHDAKLVSVHAADAGEWVPGARHDHGLAPLARAIGQHDLLFCLTSPANDPARLARLLLAAGLGEAFRLDVATRLNAPDE
ncbi:MAG TPA: precorrin-6y C5,15-methyltransferase (decarboxylating) subunit CbiE, partial [Candidatus Competibacter sp.]|nr:precorrin-6y C5,15-methyltransferase (decarboxylating) subunit CbiE [Candidatus Competibacter sp.]